MRNIQKRTLSLLVVIALLMSFIVPAVQIPASAATVTYKYSGSYIYNWGNRDEVATFLSPNAVSFYQSNGVSYDTLAAMSGSDTVSSVPSTPLYRELQELMADNHKTKTGYDATRPLYQYTDCQNNAEDTTAISSFYSGTLIGPEWDSGKTWNREHTWPNSKGLNGQDENDIMMLRPTSTKENSSRSNTAYGESGSYFDPNQYGMNIHGDVARIMLYQYVRWGNTSNMWGTSGVIESKEILLKWMEEDPVDTWEMGRNDAVESITGTRNVFVDYPELVFILFGEEVPANYSTPSNGTSVELERATVQYSENGHIASLASAYAGQKVTLPEHAGVVLPGYTFAGWVESAVTDTTTKPTVYAAGSQYTLAADTTLYALYSITEEGEAGTGTGGYVETELSSIQKTDVVVITMTYTDGTVYALDSSKGTSSAPAATTVTVNGDKLSAEPDDVLKWNIANDGGNLTIYPNGTTAKWLYCTSTNNGVRVGTNTNKVFTIDATSGYLKHTATGRYVGVYRTNPDWRCYTNTTGNTANQTLKFYVLTAGGATTTYTTTIAPCEHENTEDRAKVAAQCEIAGTEAGEFCLDCQTFISGGAEIAALEHVWVAGAVTPPTETQQGYTTYTCQNGCGQTKQDDFTDALGVTYTVKFSVPTGVTAIADAQVDGIEGTTLPVPSGTPGAGYSFVGWAESAVDATTTAPAVLGEFYIPTSNITLYAVYTYIVGGSGKTEYTLVTSADELGLGHEIVIVGVEDATSYAMSTTQNGNNRGRTEITVSNNVASWDKDAAVQLITLEEGTVDGTYAMNVGTGYLYAASASSNYLRTQASVDANASWLIEFAEGVPTVKAQGANTKNWLRHNTGNDIFSCYGSGQADVAIYSKGIPGITYYSSLSCAHEDADVMPRVAPKCEENGYEEGVYCPDCKTYIEGGAVIPMLGHDMQPGQTTPPTATEQGYTTYTCANGCGKSERRDYTDPTGEIFEVSFVVPTGVTAVASMNINALTGDTLPTAGAMTGAYNYTFAGWAEAAITEATTTVPVLYTGNYKPTEDVTLFAVYTYAVGGGTSTGESWKLVTNAANLTSGDEIAIVGIKENAYYAMGTTQNNNNRASVAATVDTATQTLTMTNDIQVITVEAGEVENTIALNVGNGYLYAAGSDKNYLRTQTTNNANGSWSVEIAATGVATLKAQGTNTKNWMRFNNTNDPYIFSCYGSGQADIYLYEKVADDGATVYYTSVATGATDPEEPTEVTELQTGDQVVIFAPAYNKALSVTKTGNYNVGVDVTIADGAVTGYGETEIFTVTVNEDGTYSFANGGQNIGMADQYTSMNLGAVNDKWEMTALGGTLFNLKNSVRATYMEWYSRYSNWSTYASTSAATDDQFQLSFYVVGSGILNAGGTTPEPEEPVEPEYPEADTTLTISEAIALGTPMTHNSYTPGKYYVTGVITEVYNTTYGNMRIKDDDGNILTVYGTYDATGEIRYDGLETKPVAGDQVTVYGVIGNYNGTAQMQKGWITAHTPGVEEPPAEPVAPEFPVSDKIIDSVADLLPGTYKMAAYLWKNSDGEDISAAPFHLWNGTVNYGDLVTSSYAFAGDTLTAAATDDAANVALVAVPGKADTYYIMVGNQYLISTDSANRSLALGTDPAEWVATDNEKGGISLSSNGVFLGSGNAKSKFLRSYTNEDTLVFGVCFFAVNVPKPADPIALTSASLELGSAMSIIFNGAQSVLDQYEDVYVLFTAPGKEAVKVTEFYVDNENGTYGFAYPGLTILDLNLQVTGTVYGTYNGVEYAGESKSTSILAYANWILFNGDEDNKSACANLLKYAIAAEAYVADEDPTVDTAGHVINLMSADQKAAMEANAYADDYRTPEKTSGVQLGTKITYVSQQLDMVSRIGLIYTFQITDTSLTEDRLAFKVTYKDSTGADAEKTFTMEDLIPTGNTNEYALKFSEFNATQMRESATLTFYIDGQAHCWWRNSIESYCNTAINYAESTAATVALAKRISLYGDACLAAYGNQ